MLHVKVLELELKVAAYEKVLAQYANEENWCNSMDGDGDDEYIDDRYNLDFGYSQAVDVLNQFKEK